MSEPPAYEFSTIRPPGEIDADNIGVKTLETPIDHLDTSYGSNSGLLSPTVLDATSEFGGRAVPASPMLSRKNHAVDYQPRQPGYTPEQSVWHTSSGQNTTVVVNQPPLHITPPNPLRPSPVNMVNCDHAVPVTCFNCNEDVITYIYYEVGKVTYVACCAMLFLGCGFGCCFFPFACDCSKDIVHKCPKCHVVLGNYKRL